MQTVARSMTFPEMVRFRAEHGVSGAVMQAARRSRTSTSEYLRRALRAQLAADGVPLPPIGNDGPDRHPPAAALRSAA
ncbi:hypothetical protein [Methylobacterium sp. A54F]